MNLKKYIASAIRELLLEGKLPKLDKYLQDNSPDVPISKGAKQRFLIKMEKLRQEKLKNGR